MSDTLPPLTAVEQMRVDAASIQAEFSKVMMSLPGMNPGTLRVLMQAHEHMNTPGARGGNLICLPAPGVAEGGDDAA